MHRCLPLAAALLIVAAPPADASWWERLFGGGTQEEEETAEDSEAAPQARLGEDTIAEGLRAALDQGIARAIEQLGRENGFWGSPEARIPLPQSLEGPAALVRRAGGDKAVDAFRRSLSRAAEQAVPEATAIFGEALQAMTLRDVRDILAGEADAATRYFRTQSADKLRERLRPVAAESIDRAGVGPAYDALRRSAGSYAALLGAPENLESHVTEHALDALFARIAEEEARIRDEAGARGSELLERVFGS